MPIFHRQRMVGKEYITVLRQPLEKDCLWRLDAYHQRNGLRNPESSTMRACEAERAEARLVFLFIVAVSFVFFAITARHFALEHKENKTVDIDSSNDLTNSN